MNMKIIAGFCFLVLVGIMGGCAQKSTDMEQKSIERLEPAPKLTVAEQQKKAYEILEEIRQLTDTIDREENILEIKAGYREIIEKCPDTGLAQESYLRLVLLAREENTPASNAEAERVYQEFLLKYPDSSLQRIIENELRKE
jgi:hypothetical protein